MRKVRANWRDCEWCAELRRKYFLRYVILKSWAEHVEKNSFTDQSKRVEAMRNKAEVYKEVSEGCCPFHRTLNWIMDQKKIGKSEFYLTFDGTYIEGILKGYSRTQEKALRFYITPWDGEVCFEDFDAVTTVEDFVMVLGERELEKLLELLETITESERQEAEVLS